MPQPWLGRPGYKIKASPVTPPALPSMLFMLILSSCLWCFSQGFPFPDYNYDKLSEVSYPEFYPSAVETKRTVYPHKRTSYISELFQAILETEETDQPLQPMSYPAAHDIRTKRPNSGLLGLDNLDFAATTLDRPRSRFRDKMVVGDMELPRSFSQPRPSEMLPPEHMSMQLSLTELREKMRELIKAGR